MRETSDLEFKETISDNYLKTVSAFANYGTGRILFGIKDDGSIVGIKNPIDTALRIENKINDALSPRPNFKLDIDQNTQVIALTVEEGPYKPYFYKSKAYKRSDSSTVEVEPLELSRLVLIGSNRTFDELPASRQDLTFEKLGAWMREKLDIDAISNDVLKTLELCDAKGTFNNAAAMVADENDFPGIDLVKFGKSINIIQTRKTLAGMSILSQYEDAMAMWKEYCQFDVIEGATRKIVESVPQEAFREAIANALVHRTWDISAHIKVSFFDDRIEVSSPGGLPIGVDEEEYLNGRVSVLRNPILGNLLFRLGIIERFGTGVTRIKESYMGTDQFPRFKVSANAILVVLPVIDQTTALNLSDDERAVYRAMSKSLNLSCAEIAKAAGFGITKTRSILKKLSQAGQVQITGTGRGTKYSLTQIPDLDVQSIKEKRLARLEF